MVTLELLAGMYNYYNFANMPESEKQIAQQRLDICKACPHFAVTSDQLKKISAEGVQVIDIPKSVRCMRCTCNMQYKLLSMASKCPIGKW